MRPNDGVKSSPSYTQRRLAVVLGYVVLIATACATVGPAADNGVTAEGRQICVGKHFTRVACQYRPPTTTAPGRTPAPTTTAVPVTSAPPAPAAPVPTTTTAAPTTTTAAPPPAPTATTAAAAPPASTRDAFLWPFASTSAWNMPVGSGAQYAASNDQRNVDLVADGAGINASLWSIPAYQSSVTDPLRTMTDSFGSVTQYRIPSGAAPSNDSDAELDIVDPTKSFIDETWMTANGGTNWTAGLHVRTDIRGDGFPGIMAANASGMAGLLRTWEIQSGQIHHALAMAIPRARLKTGWVWPARSEDYGSAGTYLGSIPMGSFYAIPASVDLNSLGLSHDGLVLAKALQDYGAYMVNASGQFVFYAEPSADPLLGGMRNDIGKIRAAMRVVTNNSPSSVGGGGTPRVALAPALG